MKFSSSTNLERFRQMNTYIPLPFSSFSGRRCPIDVLIFADYSFTNKPSIFTTVSFDSAYNVLLLRDPSDCFYSNLDVVALWHSALKFHVDWFQINFFWRQQNTHVHGTKVRQKQKNRVRSPRWTTCYANRNFNLIKYRMRTWLVL